MTTKSTNNLEVFRKRLDQQQTKLCQVMLDVNQHEKATALFLSQHAMLHSAKMTPSSTWSFEDTVLNDMSDEQIRHIPKNREHSVAWLIWHIARIEDVAMNLLVAGSPQTIHVGKWFLPMKVKSHDTGNLMNPENIVQLSATVDIDVLLAYRSAVGCRTREIVLQLSPADLKQKVESARLQKVLDEGAVVEAASDLIEYWRKRD
ncbi:MAG: DinB family protein, partial [Chloroflexi bacterium]|nr:DinB family protein [Chloroflexota bacterium]